MRRALTVLVLASLTAVPILSLAAQAGAPRPGPRSQSTGVSPSAEYRTRSPGEMATPGGSRPSEAAVRVGPASDSTAKHISNRRLHMVIGGGVGAVVGWIAGRSVDAGRAGCGREQSGLTCDWTSGYEEPAGALLGMLLGVGIGALWPHN